MPSIFEVAQANTINNNFGLQNPTYTINFNEFNPTPALIPITTQYQNYGVIFDGLVSVHSLNPNHMPGVGGNAIFSNDNHIFSILFTSNQTSAAFAYGANYGQATFSALLNGTVIESFSTSVGPISAKPYYGFTNIVFNEIRFEQGNSPGGIYTYAAYVDNLQVSTVPEPETYAMLLAGLGLIGGVARRRKQSTTDREPMHEQ